MKAAKRTGSILRRVSSITPPHTAVPHAVAAVNPPGPVRLTARRLTWNDKTSNAGLLEHVQLWGP